jgi:hypothetical protein
VKVTVGGAGVVNHARARLLCEAADAVGLTAGLSSAMAPTEQRRRGHDRGEVLVDVAVMIADGGQTISDLAVLRDQPQLFGPVASTPTAWRGRQELIRMRHPGSDGGSNEVSGHGSPRRLARSDRGDLSDV